MVARAIRMCSLLLAAGGALAGCTGLTVTSDVNPDINVSVCGTYAWAGEFRGNRCVEERQLLLERPDDPPRLRNAGFGGLVGLGQRIDNAVAQVGRELRLA